MRLPKCFWKCLQHCCKCLEELLGVCGSPAGLPAFALVFAGVPQVSRHLLWCLRESRKSPGICFGVCGSPASLPAFALAFAGSPAGLPAFALAFAGSPAGLPAFALAFAGTPAGLPAFALAFAGVPQVSRHLLWRLRGVPQVSRHLLWRLRESRKSPGICFGVCGESRKCFGEPVGRYSMLSMTFSIRVSHSFVELTLSYNRQEKRERHCEKQVPQRLLDNCLRDD